jgi:predicted transposase YdaD
VSVERTLLAGATAEGEAKGRTEGEMLDQQKMSLKLLRKGLGADEVSNLLEIDSEEVLRLSGLLEKFGVSAEDHRVY